MGRGPAADGVGDRGLGDIVKALALGHKFFGAGGSSAKRRACRVSLAAKITKALKPWTSTAEFGTLRPGWARKLGDYPGGSWAAFDAGDAAAMQKARAKFIVALDAPDRDRMFAQLLNWARKGDELHDAGGGGHLLQRSDAEALAKELSRIANAPAMALYAEIKQRLTGFAGRVRAAAPALPDAL